MKTLFIVLAMLAGSALAQDSGSAVSPSPCSGPDYQSFGFWIGTWDVTQNGVAAGRNRIQSIDNGCAMLEHWTSAAGTLTGHSLNFYDRTTDSWHQTWVDSTGSVLRLSGGLEANNAREDAPAIMSMVLRGKRKIAGGGMQENRISWTPNADGTVRQHWVQSDDGDTWTTVFDGLYQRREDAQ